MCVQHGCIKVGRWTVNSVQFQNIVFLQFYWRQKSRRDQSQHHTCQKILTWSSCGSHWEGEESLHYCNQKDASVLQSPIHATCVHKAHKSDCLLVGFYQDLSCTFCICKLKKTSWCKFWNTVKSLFDACERWKSLWAMETVSYKMHFLLLDQTLPPPLQQREMWWWQRHKSCVD